MMQQQADSMMSWMAATFNEWIRDERKRALTARSEYWKEWLVKKLDAMLVMRPPIGSLVFKAVKLSAVSLPIPPTIFLPLWQGSYRGIKRSAGSLLVSLVLKSKECTLLSANHRPRYFRQRAT